MIAVSIPGRFPESGQPSMPVFLHNRIASGTPSLGERIRATAFDTFLLVVPTRRRIRHLSRELLRTAGGPAAHALQAFTLETLATRIFARLSPAYRPLPPVAQTLLFLKACRTAGEDFRYFTLRSGTFPLQRGTFRMLVDVITGLKEAGVAPEVLDDEVLIAEPDEVHKLRDVIAMYRAYEAGLQASGSEDIAGVFRSLALGVTHGRFSTAFREAFPSVNLISIAGFDEFTEPEIGFLRKLLALPHVSVHLAFDYLPGNSRLFGHLEENYRRFHGLGLRDDGPAGAPAELSAPVPVTPAERPPDQEAALTQLASRLFVSTPDAGRAHFSPAISVIRVRDREKEAETVCRLIKRMVLDHPETDLSRICVAMYNPGRYTGHFRRAFAQYGIPANITDRFELARSPLVTGILGLLQIVSRGYRRDDVLRVAGLPYFDFPGAPDAPDLTALASVSGRLKITGGYQTWTERIDRESSGTHLRRTSHPDPRRRAELERELRLLAAARRGIGIVHRVLSPLEEPMTPALFQARLLRLLGDLGIERRLAWGSEGVSHDRRENDARAFRTFLNVVEDVVVLLAAVDDAPHPVREYLDHLTVAVAGERYNVREQAGRGVLVTAIEETRGLPVDVMVLVGMVDGEFPTVYQPEVFYSLARQKKRSRRHVWEQRYLFYQAVTNWKKALVVTYPEQEDDLELVRSTFIDALLQAADVRHVSAEELPGAGEILSERELLRACGSDGSLRRQVRSSVSDEVGERIDALALGAAVETGRMYAHNHPAYEGILTGSLGAASSERLKGMGRRVFSVSRLETYAACPFRYFAGSLLGLAPIEELDEELTPLEKGSMLHEVLFAFMIDRRARSLPDLQHCTDTEFAAASDDLLRVARERLDHLDIPDPFWQLERDLLLGGGSREGLLVQYLNSERKRTTRFSPGFFEVAFGPSMAGEPGSSDPLLSTDDAIKVGELRLRGRVDRIELGESGFSIIDYKTGTTQARLADLHEGRSLQIPLYLRAVQHLLRDRLGIDAQPAAGMHYRLGTSPGLRVVMANERFRGSAFEADSRSRQTVPDDAAFDELINRSIAMAEQEVRAMAEGRFPLATPAHVPAVCRTCGFTTVCRVQLTQRIGPESGEDA